MKKRPLLGSSSDQPLKGTGRGGDAWQCLEILLVVTAWGVGGLLLASHECSSEMLLFILQCMWHPPPRPTSHRVIRPQMSIAKTAGSEEDSYITAIVYVCPWHRTGKWWCPRSLVSIPGLPG